MAVTPEVDHRILRLARFVLLTRAASTLAAFFEHALGFEPQTCERLSPKRVTQLGIDGDAISTTLRLGRETIDLIQCDRPGRSIPTEATSFDLAFQHLAIVVIDIREAYRRLCATAGWHAISVDGPQQLPESSGGVTAFKFRDPDGHPLELLAFPSGRMPAHWLKAPANGYCIGIDHSAVSVSDVAASIAFYQALGLAVGSRAFNKGLEQGRLDNIPDPKVDVIALDPQQATPHLELLAYRDIARGTFERPGANDVAATRLVFETDDDQVTPRGLIDPDGHRIVIEPRFRLRP